MKSANYYKNCCVGCGLCHSVLNNKMETDDKGFITPIFNREEKAEFYNAICPVLQYTSEEGKFNIWGVYNSVYEAFSTNENIRFNASSGGILTALSIYLLDNKIVDGVIQTGFSQDNPLKTQTFVSRKRNDVLSHMGSRYSISSPLMNILSLVKSGEKYAFIGKPCDVMALKRYMEYSNTLSEQIILTLSFFCAGLPSDSANKKLLTEMGCDLNSLVSFQYRGNGWPGYATAVDSDGNTYTMDYQAAWGGHLGRDVNRICRYCMDGIGEAADIVCADLWYLNEDKQPDFSEHDGRNIVFCRNDLADRLFRDAFAQGYLACSPFEDMDNFDKYQPYQFSRRVTMKSRILALRLFRRFAPKYSKNLLSEADKYASKDMRKSIFIGTAKRIIKGKL